jgi:hypothetical protein
MPYEPFYERFGDLAWKETRSITIFNHPKLPADDYGLIEAYCNDENCDCRRVFFNVVSQKRKEIVAVIAYGWESKEFYAKWFRRNDPKIIRQMRGPILNPGSPQSELAPALLKMVRDMVLKDPEYIARLKRHYQLFKEKVDPKHFRPSRIQEQRAPSPALPIIHGNAIPLAYSKGTPSHAFRRPQLVRHRRIPPA